MLRPSALVTLVLLAAVSGIAPALALPQDPFPSGLPPVGPLCAPSEPPAFEPPADPYGDSVLVIFPLHYPCDLQNYYLNEEASVDGFRDCYATIEFPCTPYRYSFGDAYAGHEVSRSFVSVVDAHGSLPFVVSARVSEYVDTQIPDYALATGGARSLLGREDVKDCYASCWSSTGDFVLVDLRPTSSTSTFSLGQELPSEGWISVAVYGNPAQT